MLLRAAFWAAHSGLGSILSSVLAQLCLVV
jgi:hypothetical protein